MTAYQEDFLQKITAVHWPTGYAVLYIYKSFQIGNPGPTIAQVLNSNVSPPADGIIARQDETFSSLPSGVPLSDTVSTKMKGLNSWISATKVRDAFTAIDLDGYAVFNLSHAPGASLSFNLQFTTQPDPGTFTGAWFAVATFRSLQQITQNGRGSSHFQTGVNIVSKNVTNFIYFDMVQNIRDGQPPFLRPPSGVVSLSGDNLDSGSTNANNGYLISVDKATLGVSVSLL